MINAKKKWLYPIKRHKRGITAIVTAVAGELLFTFFLLVGFGESFWALIVSGVISLLMALLFLYGVSLSRSGRGGVEITSDSLIIFRGRQRISLPWDELEPVIFGNFFQPYVKLKAGAAHGVVYKALPGYPLVWNLVSSSQSVTAPSSRTVRINCYRTQHLAAIAASTLLIFLAAAVLLVFGIPAGQAPLLVGTVAAFFIFGGALGVWAMLRNRRTYTLEDTGITCRSWGKITHTPVVTMKGVVLEQALIRELVVGYRYRGEAMTTAVRYAPAELGLGVHLILEDGEWRLDETMTGFPMERLYEELCRRYHLPGQISIPEMEVK